MRTKTELCLAFAFAAATFAVAARERLRCGIAPPLGVVRRRRSPALSIRKCRRRGSATTAATVGNPIASPTQPRSASPGHGERQRQWMARKLEQVREERARMLRACGRRTMLR